MGLPPQCLSFSEGLNGIKYVQSYRGFHHHSQVALWGNNSRRLGRHEDSSCTAYKLHLRTDLSLQNFISFNMQSFNISI